MKPLLRIYLCLLTVVPLTLQATVIHVPADQPTIQAGINAAADGDVVLVAEGTYYENINFMGKKITVASLFYQDRRKIHIKRTVINGSKPADPNFGSVVSFVSGETIESVLCGFTITGGSGMLNAMPPGTPVKRMGGGVLCWGSGATIEHNIITGNTLSGTPWAMGGGIVITPPFVPIYAVVKDNVITDNHITGESRVTGGGMDFSAAGKILNNIITGNTATATVEAPAGGGLALQSWYPPTPANKVLVSGNTISHNKALQPDDAEYWLGGIGAGLWLIGSEGVIEKNIIKNNEVSGALSTYGAGVLLDYPPDKLTLKNNVISENYSSGSGTCYGGGLGIWDGSPKLLNNLFLDNKGSIGGGVWLGYDFCFAQLINNTFHGNQATEQGGALNTVNSHPTLMNSILWGNSAPVDAELCLESGEIDVSYCDVAGGWTGEGNMDSNPQMMNELCLLPTHSPCVDAGNPAEIYNDPENPFHPGQAKLPARGTVRNDMGAYGGPGSAGWHNVVKNQLPVAAAPRAQKKQTISCYPNPFNSQTTIRFKLDESAPVSLKIFNTLGQTVATLVDKELSAGDYRLKWDAATQASGIYYYQFKAGKQVQVNKLILVK